MERSTPLTVLEPAKPSDVAASWLRGLEVVAAMTPRDLEESVAKIVKDALVGVLEDGGDSAAFAQEIARRALRAAAAGRRDLLDMVGNQIQACAELHRIKLRRVAWGVVTDILTAVFRALFFGLVGTKR